MVTARTKPAGTAPLKAKTARQGNPARPTSTVTTERAKPSAKASKMPSPPPAGPAPKPEKPKKAKPVRDSFTMPKGEYAVLSHLKQRGLSLAHPAKKSELIRAGITVLATLSDADFLAALKALPAIKTGRPGKSESA
ncbi:MAG: hypothetical protein RIS90_1827 [Pseudomonadota bacterium]|jgi:hypothetical protein